MSTIEIGSIVMQINRKDIKNLYINVLPPDGRIRLSVPQNMSDIALRMAVSSRIAWIKKQQNVFAKQARQSDREMVSGESHYIWGKRYRLSIIERKGKHEIKVGCGWLYLYVNTSTLAENRTLVLNSFYREELKRRIVELLPIWESKLGVSVDSWGVKKMKTKWGSCNTQQKRIWLNLELAKKPVECLEYVLVHELIHILERKHNDLFKQYMDNHLPDWRQRKDLLNAMPLAYNNWIY